MSRIGNMPIPVPEGVEVSLRDGEAAVKGPKGESMLRIPATVRVQVEDGRIVVERLNETKEARSLHGTIRSVLAGMVHGVQNGYSIELEISGVGYKAQLQGQTLVLSLGFSHDINYELPAGIQVDVNGGTEVKVSGHDKALVGQVAARIRSFSPAEPYKGKGVKYKGEQIRRKEGKAVA